MSKVEIDALADNPSHLHQLCTRFELGEARSKPVQVSGGFHHRLWRIETGMGRYAIKQIADDMAMHDAATVQRLNATEVAAQTFANLGIPALTSLSHGGHHLQVLDDTGYLVFPWTDRKARKKNHITDYHAITVAQILAQMHRTNLNIAGLEKLATWPLTPERVYDLLLLAQQRNARDVEYLIQRKADILAVVVLQEAAQSVLAQRETVSHGDLDHKNVLWDYASTPLLIDWESARPINPTYELLMEALDWSGITANFETTPFENFLGAYVETGGIIIAEDIPAAFDAILGAWVNWMLFNVGRAAGMDDMRQRAIGSEQIDLSVGALLRLEKNIPRLRDIAYGYAA